MAQILPGIRRKELRMAWKYNIYVTPNSVKDTRGGFATKEEAEAAARERATNLKSSVNAPGGQDLLSFEVMEEKKNR
jgi:hypothetical protein